MLPKRTLVRGLPSACHERKSGKCFLLPKRTFVVLMVVVLVAISSKGVGAQEVIFRPPTDAVVTDTFRLPDGQYGAGNRGIEYATNASDRITSAAEGKVVFAGPVAKSLYVTIDHGSNLVSSYGPLGNILVVKGQEVGAGALIALASGPFLFTVRLKGIYIDPEPLFGVRKVLVRLVPHMPPSKKSLIWQSVSQLTAGFSARPNVKSELPRRSPTIPIPRSRAIMI